MDEHEAMALQMLKIDDDEPFQVFVILRAIMVSKKKIGVTREEITLIYKNYAKLLAERKQLEVYKKRLEEINHFVGLH